MSTEEVTKYVWAELPLELPGGYEKHQLDLSTLEAKYKGKGDWTFQARGSIRTEGSPAIECYENAAGEWVWQESKKVTTRELMLTAVFNEETKGIDITDSEKSDAEIETENTEQPVDQGLQVCWIKGQYEGQRYEFEGSIENIGRDIHVRLRSYSEDGDLLSEEVVAIASEVIEPGELAHFRLSWNQREKLRKYNFMFLTATGVSFERISEDIFILE
jgi:hypothetical protein